MTVTSTTTAPAAPLRREDVGGLFGRQLTSTRTPMNGQP
jgi:hypothetical protein